MHRLTQLKAANTGSPPATTHPKAPQAASSVSSTILPSQHPIKTPEPTSEPERTVTTVSPHLPTSTQTAKLIKIPHLTSSTSSGSLTLLFQRSTQPGLEILTPTSSWSRVPIFPPGAEEDAFPPILVNIGDLMQFWTKGLLKSTVHRVIFPEGESRDRYVGDFYFLGYNHAFNLFRFVP